MRNRTRGGRGEHSKGLISENMIVSGDPPIKTTKSPAKPHAGTKLSFHAPTGIIRQFYVVVVVVVVAVLMKTDYRESILTLLFLIRDMW